MRLEKNMPLLRPRPNGPIYNNPMGARRPDPPDQHGYGPPEDPDQGDHVFGNIIGVMRTGLMAIIGGGQDWGGDANLPGRFGSQVFDPNTGSVIPHKTFWWAQALAHWTTIRSTDLGHGAEAPVIARDPRISECDNHSLVFGGYASIFQWDLCEIGSTDGAVSFSIASNNPAEGMAWVGRVIASYNRMMNYLVDQTALTSYLNGVNSRPTNRAHPAPHTAISKDVARRQANGTGKVDEKIRNICDNFDHARFAIQQMLTMMHDINIFWNPTPAPGRWESL